MSLLYGLIAEFESPETLIQALHSAQNDGYQKIEAYSPFPVDELGESLHVSQKWISGCALVGGILGGMSGIFLQYYASVIDYPLNIGGRPYNSWPAFVPVIFELTILGASIFTLLGLFIKNRLFQYDHPLFHIDAFKRASQDHFFLCLRANDPHFDLQNTSGFLKNLFPLSLTEVPL